MTVFFAEGRKVLVHDKGVGPTSLTRPPPFDHTKSLNGVGDAPSRVGRPSESAGGAEDGADIADSDEASLDQNA